MIAEILSYVSNDFDVEQTCKKFNEIICSQKFFTLQFKSFWNDSYTKFLDDYEIFESMMQSQRRIMSLKILSESFDNAEMNIFQVERLTKVIKYFSVNIKYFELSGNVLSMDILKLLNLMPNIEKILLTSVEEKLFEIPENFKLNLQNLKEIVSLNCSETVLNCFKALPFGVLQRIHLFDKKISTKVNDSIELFRNQHNLKEVWVNTRFINFMDLRPMKVNIMIIFSEGFIIFHL